MSLPAALTRPESHPKLAKLQAAVAKKFSPKKMDPLFATVSYGWCLVALGRHDDARGLMDDVADPISFTGNFNVWTPVANAICLSARLSKGARKKALIARLVDHPALAVMDQQRLLVWVAHRVAELQKAIADPKVKPDRLASALQGVCYFEQTAGHGFFYDDWLDLAGLGADVEAGLAELARRLG